ncbi:MAG: ABC transporter ATP-binding protein [Planctomycetaceae bacterium]|nr:ABC transporter ATP-binding protein [Planctomycetaceae bacterium]MCP4478513.1 ABC transporter ATP-binding protein [Planctomycetaceae bacterium]MCP4777513.1 ABC transporter ATP-binding protein [Planctomycetaceae bacterium]
MPDFVANAVTKEFDTPTGPLRILDGISTELDRGQNMAVIGDSGSGKSTFLHIAGTLDLPSSGNVSLMGSDFTELNENQLAQFRNENIGFIFQEHHLLPQLTALENVLLPMVATGETDSNSIQRGKDLLDSVGLSDRLDHRPAALSGGERQRVAVARALIQEPILLLADEPTGSLDQANAEKTGQLLLDLQSQHNMILICVTHSSKLASVFQNQTRLVDGRFATV